MRVFLLHPDRDFDTARPLPPQAADLERDLGLDVLFGAMAAGDGFLLETVRQVVLADAGVELEDVLYRQEVLRDFLERPELAWELYRTALAYRERKREQWLLVSRHSRPASVLSGGRRLLGASLDLMRRLRQLADEHGGRVASRGLRRFFAMVRDELDDQYLEEVARHVEALRFPSGVPLSVRLGKGNEGADYVLCPPDGAGRARLRGVFGRRAPSYTFRLPPRDDASAQVVAELRDRGLARTAATVAQAADHVEGFFEVLRRELAFYLGCLNLHERLVSGGLAVAFPDPAPPGSGRFSCRALYDVSLALTGDRPVVGNDVAADGKPLVVVTGPNQGGKTTFLRSVGLAQVMMQSGMFVPAAEYAADLCRGLFTHFRREEDRTVRSGKLEEELQRMSAIVDRLRPQALLLLNESFAATSEVEGSEIAWQVTRALLDHGVRVVFVTHLYRYARRCHEEEPERCLHLRAERLPDGTRTFRVRPSPPTATSHGMDLYRRIFADAGDDGPAG
jgi:hypothetical protein